MGGFPGNHDVVYLRQCGQFSALFSCHNFDSRSHQDDSVDGMPALYTLYVKDKMSAPCVPRVKDHKFRSIKLG